MRCFRRPLPIIRGKFQGFPIKFQNMSLRQLSKETVHVLTSSQVITSVYAVVKELVENSLDAKATSIEVKLENFGLNMIEVRDNGSGIKKEDTVNMAKPHFTSKLVTFKDLESLEHYGFRGEALSSIAAVSNLSITTRTQADAIATTYTLDHSGTLTSTKHSHLGQGTIITVANIFKNLPVRKQCFKSAKRCKEELRKVEDVMIGFGLAHYGLRLTLKHNRSIIWQKIQTSDFGSNVSLILGAAMFQQLVPLNYQSFSPMVKIRAFVPKSEADLSMVSRSTSDKIYLLVNQRCVAVKPLIQLLKEVFSDTFPSQSGRYPVAVVMITVPPADIDVNLEPNKTLVLLQNMDFILSTMESLLAKLYSRCKVAGSEAATNSSGKTETAGQATMTDCQQNPSKHRAIEMMSPPHSEIPPIRSLDPVTGSGDVRSHVSVFQRQSSRENPSQTGVSDSPSDNTADTITQCQRYLSELESCDMIASGNPLIDQRSGAHRSSEGDMLMPRQELEFFELLDISEFENDSSESLPPSPNPRPETQTTQPRQGTETTTASSFQFNQISLSQWSRGETLRDCSGRPIEPVRVLISGDHSISGQHAAPTHSLPPNQPPSQSKLNYKGPAPIFDMIHSKPVKRKADASLSVPSPGQGGEPASAKRHKPLPSLLQKLVHGDNAIKDSDDVPCKELSVDLNSISRRSSTNYTTVNVGNSVIGFVNPPGVWLVSVDGNIACFNTNISSASDLSLPLSKLSLPPSRKEVKQLLKDILTRSKSASTVGDHDYLDINHYLHNLAKL